MPYKPKLPEDRQRTPALTATLAKLLRYEQSANIADDLPEADLDKIGMDVCREYDIDKKSRGDWEESAERAMDIALQVRKPKNYPFPGAANIKYPLVTVAALQFGARAYPAIVDGNRIVKTMVLGSDQGKPAMGPDGQPIVDPQTGQPQWEVPPGAKQAKADRISQHMSYQLLCQMEEWEEDTDVLLHHLPIVGCAFRKVWRSDELKRNKAEMVPAIHLVVNNKVRNLEEAPRVTHEIFLYPQDIEERKLNGTFSDVDLVSPQSDTDTDDDAPHTFLEQHRYLDLDEDGYREPYIVTVHKDDQKVVRIVANYRMEAIRENGKRIVRIPKDQYFVKYSFIPDPKGGFYDIGFGRLLESLSETIDTTINQMLDAGHIQNAGGGFIGSGLRLKKNKVSIAPGRFEMVESSGNLRDQIYNFEHRGPSPVLFQLLGMMIEGARDITATKDIMTGDSGGKTQTATTTLALIEQGLKVFTAIYKRIYRALKDEFKLLFELNSRHLDDQEYYTFLDEPQVVAKADYDTASMDVAPVADPKMVTDMQRQARAQVLLQISEHPVLGPLQDGVEVLKRVYDAMGIEEAAKLIKPQQVDPLMQANAEAEVRKKNASAMKDEATAEKVAQEVAFKPAEMKMEVDKVEAEQARFDKEEDRLERDQEMSHAGMISDHILDVQQLKRDEEVQHRSLDVQERAAKSKAKATA